MRRFLIGEIDPWALALAFGPVFSLIAGPPLLGVTEVEPFVATTAVAFCLSTPTCVVESDSTTIWLPGVRTVETSSVVATSTDPICIWTELLFFDVAGLNWA